MRIEKASVKVMRSHDYCHFETVLSIGEDSFDSSGSTRAPGLVIEDIDAARKVAARLVDKAVEQYKVAKINAERSTHDAYSFERLKVRAKEANEIPEADHDDCWRQ